MHKHILSGLFVLFLLLVSFPLFAEIPINLKTSSVKRMAYNYSLSPKEQISLTGFGEQLCSYNNKHKSSAVETQEELVSEPTDCGRERKVELSANLLLSSGQHIVYNYGLLLEEQISLIGFGAQLGAYYNIHERFAVGMHIGFESFQYSDLMDYKDTKFDGSVRIRINKLNNKFFGLFVNCFVGTDFVLREDRATAIYYMHGCGASLDLRMSKKMYFNTGCNMAVTFQDGSAVSHLAGYMGISWVRE